MTPVELNWMDQIDLLVAKVLALKGQESLSLHIRGAITQILFIQSKIKAIETRYNRKIQTSIFSFLENLHKRVQKSGGFHIEKKGGFMEVLIQINPQNAVTPS